jgi:hypothetical protein
MIILVGGEPAHVGKCPFLVGIFPMDDYLVKETIQAWNRR